MDTEIDEVCRFLESRNVESNTIKNFKDNKMDKQTVCYSSDADLQKMGLSERGHIVCLKTFCMIQDPNRNEEDQEERSVRKQELASFVKQSSKERVSSKSGGATKKAALNRLQMKSVQLGWMHYDDSKKSMFL